MANLDNFFAKKDKKKKGKGKKFTGTSTAEMVKALEVGCELVDLLAYFKVALGFWLGCRPLCGVS